jgi:hypothetical protein
LLFLRSGLRKIAALAYQAYHFVALGVVQHKQWILALHEEARAIWLESKLDLPHPVIALHQSEQIWGRWDPLNLRITIAQCVIESCPWHVVVQILKHELAHQVADHFHPEESALAPHGKRFHEACERLRVQSWARRASSGKSLSELQNRALIHKQEEASQETLRYRRRLHKLLALAQSGNEHEALLAMQRAQELRDERGLQDDLLDPFVSLIIGSGKQRHAPYEGRIASILMSHFHVDIVFSSSFNATTCKKEALIDILGRREDVLLAEHVHTFLHRSCLSLWESHQKHSQTRGLRERNSYIRGILAGFHEELDNQHSKGQRRQNKSPGKKKDALVRKEEGERQEFVRSHYPRLGARREKARIDGRQYRKGKKEGSRLRLRKPVESGSPSRVHSLPPGS